MITLVFVLLALLGVSIAINVLALRTFKNIRWDMKYTTHGDVEVGQRVATGWVTR